MSLPLPAEVLILIRQLARRHAHYQVDDHQSNRRKYTFTEDELFDFVKDLLSQTTGVRP